MIAEELVHLIEVIPISENSYSGDSKRDFYVVALHSPLYLAEPHLPTLQTEVPTSYSSGHCWIIGLPNEDLRGLVLGDPKDSELSTNISRGALYAQ